MNSDGWLQKFAKDERVYKALHERNALQRKVARKTFALGQRLGFHIAADHFYDPLPNMNMIRV